MREHLSSFNVPARWPFAMAAYPSNPVQPLTKWLVRMVVDAGGRSQLLDMHVWAFSSTDAVYRARDDFYGTWATQADRERLPLRVLEVLQEAV
jgi:hypothetical protein